MKIWKLSLLAGLGFTACTADQTMNPVCFETEVLPIFQLNCATADCHNAIDLAEGLNLSSFDGITNLLEDKGKKHLLNSIKGKGDVDLMPPAPHPPLSEAQISIIEDWLSSGAKNTVNCTDCDTLAVSFSQDIFPVFQAQCNGCHSGSAPGGGYDFTTYSNIVDVTGGFVEGSIRHEAGFIPMPEGGSKMSDCNIAKLVAWVNAGTPNN